MGYGSTPHHPAACPTVADTAALHGSKRTNGSGHDFFHPGPRSGSGSLLPYSVHQRKAEGSPGSRGGETESTFQWERLESTGRSEECGRFHKPSVTGEEKWESERKQKEGRGRQQGEGGGIRRAKFMNRVLGGEDRQPGGICGPQRQVRAVVCLGTRW